MTTVDRDDHLPRPLLPRPAQQGLHAAARVGAVPARGQLRGDGTHRQQVLLLRRGRRSHGMEETLGTRINVNRSDEALGTGAAKIAVGCPFCNVMLNDGVTMRKQEGTAAESIEVLDVAALLLGSVKQ